jgi:hypothetical protein
MERKEQQATIRHMELLLIDVLAEEREISVVWSIVKRMQLLGVPDLFDLAFLLLLQFPGARA